MLASIVALDHWLREEVAALVDDVLRGCVSSHDEPAGPHGW
jgi:hypothetical protein